MRATPRRGPHYSATTPLYGGQARNEDLLRSRPRPPTLQINELPLGTHTNFCAVERVSHFPPNLILILPQGPGRDGFLRERGMDFLRVVSRARRVRSRYRSAGTTVGPSAQSILRLFVTLCVCLNSLRLPSPLPLFLLLGAPLPRYFFASRSWYSIKSKMSSRMFVILFF